MPRSLSEIIEDQQQLVIDIYLKEISLPEQELLLKFLPAKPPKNPNLLVKEFFTHNQETQLMIGNHLARIADMQARVRNAVSSKFATHIADQSPLDAFSFRFTLNKFAETNGSNQPRVSSDQLQHILDQCIISNSITAHPTNPYSTAYTVESMNLDHILATEIPEENYGNKLEILQAQIRKMIAMDPVPEIKSATDKGKKTQQEEVIEAMSYMRNIYEQLPIAKRKMQETLEEQGYSDVKLGNFYEMGAWLAGDGDGNPAATAKSLQDNINLFRQEVSRLYTADLNALKDWAVYEADAETINQIINKLNSGFYPNPSAFIHDLQNLQTLQIKTPEPHLLEDLIYRVENFGFHYAKIDVRHDAADINISVVEVLAALGEFKNEQDKNQCLKDLQDGEKTPEYSKYLSDYLGKINKNPQEILAILQGNLNGVEQQLKTFSKEDQSPAKSKLENSKKSLETTMRIFGRLQVVAANPGCSDKLIIAECKNGTNALGAMFLLKASGNSVNQKGSLNIVTLSESANDLMALPENIEALLKDQTYRDHVARNGKLFYMIAKSDTQRRDGVTAQYAQEAPPERITELFVRLAKEFPELRSVKLVPFNGGGHALQRGGGRIDEIPNVYAKAEMRGLHWFSEHNYITILPPILTTQGHQNGILFSAENSGNFLISYFSQAAYAEAKLRGLIPEPEVLNENGSVNVKAEAARMNRELFFNVGRKVYEKEISTPNSPINILFRQGPWAGIELTNVSSRPGKRVENSDLQLIDQRAIGAERMCAHSGTHLISWYSAKAGLEAITNQPNGLNIAASMYKNDKSTRDTFRSMAMSLFMTDFNLAWKMMIGDKPEKPSLSVIKNLAELYKPEEQGFKNLAEKERNQITLAHIEVEAIKTAQLLHKIIVNDKEFYSVTPPELSDLAPKELLTQLWPNLATEIKARENKLEFAHLVEAKLTSGLPNEEKRYPKDPMMEKLIRTFNTACVGSEAPTLQSLDATKQVGDQSVGSLIIEKDLSSKLSVVGPLPPSRQNLNDKGAAALVPPTLEKLSGL